MKKYFWLVSILIAVTVAVFFGDHIVTLIAPKVVLNTALNRVCEQLETRFADDPLCIAAGLLNPEGRYTLGLELETSKPLIGSIHYDLVCRADTSTHRYIAQGAIGVQEKELDFSLYLDSEFLALSSKELHDEGYLGITYDTFGEDIRKIPLLSLFVSESIFASWNQFIQDLQRLASKEYRLLRAPNPSEIDWRSLRLGVLATPCRREKRSISLGDTSYNCQVLSYSFSESQLKTVLPESIFATNGTVTISFYLWKQSLVYVLAEMETPQEKHALSFELGERPAVDDLCMKWQDSETSFSIIANIHNNLSPGQRLVFKGLTDTDVSYDWIPNDGMLYLTAVGKQPVSVTIQRELDGLSLYSEDFSGVYSILFQNKKEIAPIKGTIHLSVGTDVQTPNYRNLDMWSLEDFLILIENISALIGAKFCF